MNDNINVISPARKGDMPSSVEHQSGNLRKRPPIQEPNTGENDIDIRIALGISDKPSTIGDQVRHLKMILALIQENKAKDDDNDVPIALGANDDEEPSTAVGDHRLEHESSKETLFSHFEDEWKEHKMHSTESHNSEEA